MSSQCLICSADIGSSISIKSSYNFPGSLNSTLLNEQLWSTFILTKIVQLPNWKFESLLKSTAGVHPGRWFDLCDICGGNVVNIVDIQNQIKVLQLKVDKLLNKVQDKFKSSLVDEETIKENNGDENEEIEEVSQEIRQFFKTTKEPKVEIDINVDTEILQEIEDDWIWEPSSNLGQDDNDHPSSESEDWKRPIIKNKKTKTRNVGHRASGRGQDFSKGYYIPGAFQCTICPRKLKTQDLLDKHYNYHDYTKRKYNGKFDCTICKTPCARLFHLKNHYKNVHKLKLPNEKHENNQEVITNQAAFKDLNLKMEVDIDTGDNNDNTEPLNILNDYQVEAESDGKPKGNKEHNKKTLVKPSNVAAAFIFHQCSICPRKLKCQALLDQHNEYHEYTRRKFNGRFDCTICKAPVSRLFHLKNHYKNVHKLKLPENWDVNKDDKQEVKVRNSSDVHLNMDIDLEPQNDDDDDDKEPPNISNVNQVEKNSSRKKGLNKKAIKHFNKEAATFQCTMCTQKYRSQISLDKHLDYHRMTKTKYNGKFDCDKCGTPFARILHLTNHYRNVHQCTLNDVKFKGHYDDLLAEQNNFKCSESECKFSCEKEAGLKYHLKVKHQKNEKVNHGQLSTTPTPLVCELCGFIAKEGDYGKGQMKRHMLNHKIFDNSINPSISTTDLICTLCNQLFKSRTDLRSHKVTIHASELGLTSHQCSYCPRLFPNKQNLFHHEQRIHKKKGRFPCPHCDHEAMNPYRLGQHMAKHTKDRDICQYCSATYTKTGGRLREHIKRHHPDKYTPSTSRLKFGGVPFENSDLIEKKPKLRKFKCKYCCGSGGDDDGVIFDSQLAYTMHLEESHKDLYKFQCDLCGNEGDEKKVYMSLTSLNYHKKIHHQEKGKGVSCGWCGTKVAHKFYLYGHRKNCRSRPEGAIGILAVENNDGN